MTTTSQGYCIQLLSELNRRKSTNPRYSLRAFAKTLQVSPSYLSKILRGEKTLSLETAVKIAEKLQYSENESLQFCHLVQQSHIQSPKLKKALRLEESETDSSFVPVSLEAFQVISDWHHLALRELTECRHFKNTPAAIAERLGISTQEAQLALQRLLRLGLLAKDGNQIKKTAASVSVTLSDRPQAAIKAFHTQMIDKAQQALDEQDTEERDITGITVPISPEKIKLAREEIKKFRRRMLRLMESSKPTEVYQMNIQLFRLTKLQGSRS